MIINYIILIIILIILLYILYFLYDNDYKLSNLYIYIKDLRIIIKNFDRDLFIKNVKINLKNKNKEKYILEKLPILAPYNREKYLNWHLYYENIYNKSVDNIIDLNTFNWFYWNCPIDNIKKNINIFTISGMVKNCNTCIGMPYILTDYFIKGPEIIASEIGFFVNRDINIDKNINKIEVFRVENYNIGTVYNLELYSDWYWITKGSGKFIDIDIEKTLVLKDRNDWFFDIPFNECDKESCSLLKKKNIKYLIFTDSFSYSKTMQRRPELIVIK